jgi:hypothetical protein
MEEHGFAQIPSSHPRVSDGQPGQRSEIHRPLRCRGQGSGGFERPEARRSHRNRGRGKKPPGGRGPVPDGIRAGRSNGGRGVVPGARLSGLTNKAGMSISFMGIMLATARSIKDSDSGLEAAGLVPDGSRAGRSNSAAAWCLARDWVGLQTKPECPLVSWRLRSRLLVQSRIQIVDWRRVGPTRQLLVVGGQQLWLVASN